MSKLTTAQSELLAEVCDSSLCYCVRTYKPAQRLVSMGLAVWDAGDRDYLYATGAGRLALAEEGRDG